MAIAAWEQLRVVMDRPGPEVREEENEGGNEKRFRCLWLLENKSTNFIVTSGDLPLVFIIFPLSCPPVLLLQPNQPQTCPCYL